MANKSKILKFSKKQEHRINAINIIDNTLYFTDNNSEPKRIELDRFRNADHSSGTTNVYGRPFQERDITVIRNTPMKSLDAGLSEEVVPIEAAPPKLLTGNAVAHKTSASLYGSLTSEGADIKTVGFYYIQQDTLPSENEILTKGKYSAAIFYSGGSFISTSVTGLTKQRKYWYVAVGYNGVNELAVARYENQTAMIKSFTTKGDSFSAPTVDTVQPIKIAEGTSKFKLRGVVSGNGGGNIVETGFYVLKISDTEDQTKPSSLVSNELAVKYEGNPSLTDPVSAQGFAQYEFTPFVNGFQKFWVQFYAKNSAGFTGYGDVEGPDDKDLVAKPLPGIRINDGRFLENGADNARDIELEVDVQITYKPGEIREVGVYFSKIASDKTTMLNYLAKPVGSRKVWKVENTTVNGLNYLTPFKVSEGLNTEFSIEPGDRVYALAYIKCIIDGANVIGYSDYNISANGFQANPFTHIAKPDTTPPSVITKSFEQWEDTDQAIRCELQVVGNGIGTNPLEEAISAEGNEITSAGFVIARLTAAQKIEMDGYSDVQKRYKILGLLDNNLAYEFVFKTSNGNDITEPGIHENTFFPNNIVELVGNDYYYGFAWATNNISDTPGYGEVLHFQYKEPDDDTEPSVGLRFHENPNGQAMYSNFGTFPTDTIGVRFVGVIDRWVKGQDQIHDYGVVWQAGEKEDFDFDASVTAGRKASFVSIGTESDEHHDKFYSPFTSTQRNKINEELTNRTPATAINRNRLFGILLEASIFTDVSYTNNQSQIYSAQLYIQYTSGGEYVKGTMQGPGQITEVNDIREFTIREDTTYNFDVPKLSLEKNSVDITKAEVTAKFLEISSNATNASDTTVEDINLYYKPSALTTGSTDALKIANVVSSGYKIDHFDIAGIYKVDISKFSKGDYFKTYFGDEFQQYHPIVGGSASYPELEANTEYYMVATAKTGTTATSDISALGAGVGHSNLLTLKTKEEPKSSVYWTSTSATVHVDDRAGVVTFNGSLSENIVKTALSLYIIPKTDISGNPPSAGSIVADPDTITIDAFSTDLPYNKASMANYNKSSQNVVRRYEGLQHGTSFWYVWGVRAAGFGEILSPVDDFKTSFNVNNTAYGSIIVPEDVFVFNQAGERYIPTQQEIDVNFDQTSKGSGFYIPFSTTPPGTAVSMQVVDAYPENAKNLLFLTQDSHQGKRYIRAALDATAGAPTNTRRWKVMLRFASGPDPLNYQTPDAYAIIKYIYFEQYASNANGGGAAPSTGYQDDDMLQQ